MHFILVDFSVTEKIQIKIEKQEPEKVLFLYGFFMFGFGCLLSSH